MSLPLQSQPWNDPVLEGKPWTMGFSWGQWLDALRTKIAGVFTAAGVTVAQSAVMVATPATSLLTEAADAGLYRLTYLAQVTQAATTSSSLQVTIRWTSNGTAQSRTGAALTGNLLTTQEGVVLPIDVDAGTAVTVEAAYSSVGATPMQYRLTASLERAS